MKREVGPIIRPFHIIIFILILVIVLALIEMVSQYFYTGRFRAEGGTALAADETISDKPSSGYLSDILQNADRASIVFFQT